MSNLIDKGQIFYLCLEPVREGHASYTHVIEIVQGLEKLKWKVKLFKPSYEDKKLPSFYTRLLGMLRAQWDLIRSHKKPDLIYIRCHPFSFIVALWAKWKGIKVFQEVNGPYEDLFIAWPWTRYFSFFFKKLYRWQFQGAHHIITVTHGLKNFIQKEANHERITIITNGVNTELFNPKAKTNYNLPSRFVLFFGTFSKWHGIPLLLKAVEQSEWPHDVKLIFMGDGIEKKLIEEKVKEENKVIYLGRKPYNEVPGIIVKSIAGLVPIQSIKDRASTGLSPLKLFETIACGIPVIVSDQPEQSDFVQENKCGWIVKEQTPQAWAKAVQEVTNKKFSSSMKISRKVMISISWSEKTKILEGIILNTLK